MKIWMFKLALYSIAQIIFGNKSPLVLVANQKGQVDIVRVRKITWQKRVQLLHTDKGLFLREMRENHQTGGDANGRTMA